MKVLIVRMYPYELNIKNYNCQELGLAKELVRRGNTCDIVLYTKNDKSFEEDYIFDGNKRIHIYYLKAKNIMKNAFFEKKLYKIAEEYDVVQTSEYDQIANVRLKKHCKKMVIYHGPYESQYTIKYRIKCIISDIYFLFHPNYKKNICIAKSKLASELLYKKGFRKVNVIGVGIDKDRFMRLETDNLKIEFNKNFFYLLYVGKIEPRRNPLFLLELLSKLNKDSNTNKLVIVGKGKKKYLNKIKNYAKKKNLLSDIIYFESLNQEELSVLYKKCNVFILPSCYEIFGMVILESMYFGLPVITTYNGGSSIMINKDNGLFIKKTNRIDDWIDTLKILKTDKNYYKKISKNAKKTVDFYSWDNLCDFFINVYNIEEEKR